MDEKKNRYNTWGPLIQTELGHQFDASKFPNAQRVMDQHQVSLIQCGDSGEPIKVALGKPAPKDDPQARQAVITPLFGSLEALEFFCQMTYSNREAA